MQTVPAAQMSHPALAPVLLSVYETERPYLKTWQEIPNGNQPPKYAGRFKHTHILGAPQIKQHIHMKIHTETYLLGTTN